MAEPPPLDPAEIRFPPGDFEKYHERIQRDPEFNDARLVVRRKLDAIGKHLARTLSGKDLELVSRATLHHPYSTNGFRVSSQAVYLSRGEKERKAIQRHLGVDLGKDLDQNYTHAILLLEINEDGLLLALRIHKAAWWDGENLKRGLQSLKRREELATVLDPLGEYGLRIGDHRRVRRCAGITERDLSEAMGFYTPGEQWLHIERFIEREDPFVTEEELLPRLTEQFQLLLPAYRAIRWSKRNDQLFGGGA